MPAGLVEGEIQLKHRGPVRSRYTDRGGSVVAHTRIGKWRSALRPCRQTVDPELRWTAIRLYRGVKPSTVVGDRSLFHRRSIFRELSRVGRRQKLVHIEPGPRQAEVGTALLVMQRGAAVHHHMAGQPAVLLVVQRGSRRAMAGDRGNEKRIARISGPCDLYLAVHDGDLRAGQRSHGQTRNWHHRRNGRPGRYL